MNRPSGRVFETGGIAEVCQNAVALELGQPSAGLVDLPLTQFLEIVDNRAVVLDIQLGAEFGRADHVAEQYRQSPQLLLGP